MQLASVCLVVELQETGRRDGRPAANVAAFTPLIYSNSHSGRHSCMVCRSGQPAGRHAYCLKAQLDAGRRLSATTAILYAASSSRVDWSRDSIRYAILNAAASVTMSPMLRFYEDSCHKSEN